MLETPIQTHRGLITHNGSLTYTSGIWANDPVEYSSPLFPFFDDKDLNEASMNMYRIWLNHCREHGIDSFPGSFEHEALRLTQRDRGDDAMVSDKLWPNRMQGGDILAASDRRETEWGRETYYALRVLFKAGRTEQALDLTKRVVKAQIFGPRGPYPDEDAIDMLCPSSLYPRVFTEGVFGISPLGFDRFECVPHLPAAWPKMALRDMRAFGCSWDLVVERDGAGQKVTVLREGKLVFSGNGPAGTVHVVDVNP